MYSITNNDKGPRGFFVVAEDGQRERVVVQPGATISRELSEAQAEKLAKWPSLKVREVEADEEGDDEDQHHKYTVRKFGKKYAVFTDGERSGEPTTKAKADAEAKALREADEQ